MHLFHKKFIYEDKDDETNLYLFLTKPNNL